MRSNVDPKWALHMRVMWDFCNEERERGKIENWSPCLFLVIPAVYKSQRCSRAEFESPCELRKLKLHPFDDAVESAFVFFCIFPFFFLFFFLLPDIPSTLKLNRCHWISGHTYLQLESWPASHLQFDADRLAWIMVLAACSWSWFPTCKEI